MSHTMEPQFSYLTLRTCIYLTVLPSILSSRLRFSGHILSRCCRGARGLGRSVWSGEVKGLLENLRLSGHNSNPGCCGACGLSHASSSGEAKVSSWYLHFSVLILYRGCRATRELSHLSLIGDMEYT